MAWTTPRTMVTGTTGTVADWNTYIRDNENYLYNAFPNIVFKDVTVSRAVGSTNVYQNTTASVLFCRVRIQSSSTAAGANAAYVASTSPPGVFVDQKYLPIDVSKVTDGHLTFFVRSNYYYTIGIQSNVSLAQWFEYGIAS